jgi:TonB family protein
VSISPNPPVSRRPPRRVGFWLAVAVLIHAELALLLGFAVYTLAPRDADLKRDLAARTAGQPESIDIGMVDDAAAREIIADLDRQAEQKKAEEVKKEVEAIDPRGQVVDVPVPREERRPDQAKFLSEHDTTVEKETRKYGKFDEKARQGDAAGNAPQSKPDSPRQPETTDQRLAMREPQVGRTGRTPGPNAPEHAPEQPGSHYGAPEPGAPSPDGSLPQLGKLLRTPAGGGASPSSGATLMPSEQQMARAVGSGSQDALKDIDDGEETALNSKRWKFASFFNRVKKQVADHWHPEEAYRRGDPTGSVYGSKNRLTVLRVQLKPDGSLANVALEQPSGVEFLDDEAIEAFKQAQPFPNPPRQLVDDGGVINFRFGFLFELSGAPRMRLFRYND